MKRKLNKIAIGLLLAGISVTTQGSVVFYNDDITSFEAASTTSIVEDFEGVFPKNSAIRSFTSNGINYTSHLQNLWVTSAEFSAFEAPKRTKSVLTGNGNEDFFLVFKTPVTAVGFNTYLNSIGPVAVEVIGNNGILDSFSLSPNPSQMGFLGITSTEEITSIRWEATAAAGIDTGIDNIRTGGAITQIPAVDSCQLYAVNDKGLNNSQFFTVDQETLAVKPLGEMYEGYDIEALDIHPETGILYAASGDDTDNPGHLYTVNPQTGALNDLGYTGFQEIEGLSFNKNTLWAWAKGDGLISIEPQSSVTGTLIIPSRVLVEDLTWDSTGTWLYAVENNRIWMSDGKTVKKACDNFPEEIEALEMLPDGKLLLGIHGNRNILPFQAINVETCEIVFRAGLPTRNYDDIEGIAWPEKACAEKTIETQQVYGQSCQDILVMNPSSDDGFYLIDPDGPGEMEAFEAYCDMTHEGGGWTLYAHHADGIATLQTREQVTPTDYAVMTSTHWQTVRDNMTTGMMFIDEHERVSTISASKLRSGNCTSIPDVDDLSNPPHAVWPHAILHNEKAGCSATGMDYSLIELASETYHSYRIAGAALYQLSAMKFDKWPYSGSVSYGQQNTLLYYIK
ncbi:MAG: fibrinogen-like YCDxxxxGGGW domain-containing protein [Candidatus Parabeggiatoa sp.]|nr:fibrinogen-like YCDxxxxGGGW domain-containing protein [Candidatus Parabeggiatoa sp.]